MVKYHWERSCGEEPPKIEGVVLPTLKIIGGRTLRYCPGSIYIYLGPNCMCRPKLQFRPVAMGRLLSLQKRMANS